MTNFFGHAKTMREIIKSVQLGTNELGSERHSGLPLLKMGNLMRGSFNFNKLEFIQEGNPKLNEQYILKRGDFLFNTRNTLELVGKSAVWKDRLPNAIFNNNIMRIIFTNDINSFYLSYYFEHDIGWSKLKRIATGTTSVAAIYTRDLYNVEVILPSYREQKKIVEVLMTVDNSLEKTEALIEKYKNIKQGLMQDLLTKGIDEQGNIRSEETHEFEDSPIGRIPREWDALTVEATVDSVMDFRGKTPLKIGMDWGGGEIPAISANNVVMGKIDLSKGTYYGSEALYKKWMVKGPTQNGDVIITMEAPLGNIAQITNDDKYILSQRVLLLRTRSALLKNEYLALIFMSDEFQKQLNKYASGTTAQGIQQAKLFELYIPVPRLTTEQQRIYDYINTINNKICMEEIYLKKLCFMKQGLMQDLLTGKVRVPLEEATG